MPTKTTTTGQPITLRCSCPVPGSFCLVIELRTIACKKLVPEKTKIGRHMCRFFCTRRLAQVSATSFLSRCRLVDINVTLIQFAWAWNAFVMLRRCSGSESFYFIWTWRDKGSGRRWTRAVQGSLLSCAVGSLHLNIIVQTNCCCIFQINCLFAGD